MFLFTIELKVDPDAQYVAGWEDVEGAFVACYVSFKNLEIAEKIAKWAINDQGWIVEKMINACKLQKRMLKDEKHKRYYAEALKFGYCLEFYLFPIEAVIKILPTASNRS